MHIALNLVDHNRVSLVSSDTQDLESTYINASLMPVYTKPNRNLYMWISQKYFGLKLLRIRIQMLNYVYVGHSLAKWIHSNSRSVAVNDCRFLAPHLGARCPSDCYAYRIGGGRSCMLDAFIIKYFSKWTNNRRHLLQKRVTSR